MMQIDLKKSQEVGLKVKRFKKGLQINGIKLKHTFPSIIFLLLWSRVMRLKLVEAAL